jgi:demethylmenaquinone methyltransferase/2-methoxy-6-polyprenyl-1,4-benzoquinol methylase
MTFDAHKKTTHFGYTEVPTHEKSRRVADVFHSVAPKYDLMNDLMSGGLHRLWKRFTIDAANLRPGQTVLDVAANDDFDCITIAFGLRNVTDKLAALKSMYRVLKPGGKLLILEFSHPQGSLLNKLYDFYSFNVIPRLGQLISRDRESYQYLVESIRMHPNQETLKTMLSEAGFEDVTYVNLTGGIVALHTGYKY